MSKGQCSAGLRFFVEWWPCHKRKGHVGPHKGGAGEWRNRRKVTEKVRSKK